jgi:ABC-type transport system involved in multi-copper enzyme maturation permease subunit
MREHAPRSPRKSSSVDAGTIAALLEPAIRVTAPDRELPVMRRDREIAWLVARHELGANLRAAIAWLAPLAGLVILVCALQPTFAAGPLAAKIDSLPRAMRDALGLAVVDFHRPAAYLATNLAYVALGTALFGGVLGARIVAKEEIRHTAELLYAQPARRGPILAGKAIALSIYVFALPCLLAVIAMAMLAEIVPAPLEPALVASLFAGCACVALLFAGVGVLVATTLRARSAGSATVAIVLVTFVLGMFSGAVPALHVLRWISPPKIVEATGIVARGGLAPGIAFALLGIGAGCVLVGMARYRRRDLHA